MFIRQTKTSTASSGESYFTFRLVASKRVGDKVTQKTLLNLGRHFDLARERWPELCIRIDAILAGEGDLFATEIDTDLEGHAQHIYSQLIALRAPLLASQDQGDSDFQEVDVNSVQLTKPRSVGVEHVSLEALKDLELPKILERAGLNGAQQSAALGNIVARMCHPQSEWASGKWLSDSSALGELLDFDFESMSHMQLYRASDLLLKNKEKIEDALFNRVQDLFGFTPTVTLYDLTNTFFEGQAAGNAKAKRGRSKEKRSDCPLVTLGLMLDGSGFIRHSEIFEGSVNEGGTLVGMLEKLKAPAGALIIMDAGIASQENIDWLSENNYKYLVVSRERKRIFDIEKAASIESASGHKIHLQRESDATGSEVKLYCWSEERASKDEAINESFRQKFEAELQKVSEGLRKPRCMKKRDKINQRLGRLKERFSRVAQHYRIECTFDSTGNTVTNMEWHYEPTQASKLTHPGVYCLRSNQIGWNDETLWRTYTMLTDLEAVFRSLKSELGMRPVYHRTQDRCDGHLFITVLAYQAVQVVRRKLKEANICESWSSLREILEVQRRVTVTFKQKDGRTMHVRKATLPEEQLQEIYKILAIDTNPGGTKKMTI